MHRYTMTKALYYTIEPYNFKESEERPSVFQGLHLGFIVEDTPVRASSKETAHLRWASLELEITHRESVVHLMRPKSA